LFLDAFDRARVAIIERVNMADSEGAPDLRKCRCDQRERFITSVSKEKNAMPPWGDLLKPDEIEALWAYMATVGKN
jgi:hypothetical protein